MTGEAKSGALEALQNDADALTVLLRLYDNGTLRDALADATIHEEPDAIGAWLRERLREVQNTIDAAEGAGPPCAVVRIEVRGGVAEVVDCPPGVDVDIRDWDNEGAGE